MTQSSCVNMVYCLLVIKSWQNSTGSIFCTFPATMHVYTLVGLTFVIESIILLLLLFLQITDDGAVYRDGRLRVGQRILEVNGQSLLGGSHQEAVRALRSVGDKLVIMICDGFDPDLEEEPSPDTPSSPLGYLPRMRKNSGSSIDKVDEEHLIIMKVSPFHF